MTQQLTNNIFNAALENLTSKRRQIDEQITEIHRMLGNSPNGAAAPAAPVTRTHTISAAGRRAIAAAQKRRWAMKKAAESGTAEAKPKRKLSAEGRRNIVNALKKRWAAKRAAAAKPARRSSTGASSKKAK